MDTILHVHYSQGTMKSPLRHSNPFRRWKSAIGFFAAMLVASCAGANLAKFAVESELPPELSAEFKDQFTVRDGGKAAPSPSPSPEPSVDSPPGVNLPVPRGFVGKAGATSPGGGSPSPSQGASAGKVAGKAGKGSKGQAPALSGEPTRESSLYPSRRPASDPLWLGEKHHFNVEYLGVKVGDCNLEVMPPKIISNRKAYHVKGHGWSTKMFSLVYRIDDRMETFFDFDSFVSHKFRLILDESKQTRDSQELNDPVKKKTFFWNRMNTPGKGFVEKKIFTDIPSLSQDSLSQLYFLRTLPLKDGDKYTFPVVTEGKILDATAVVLGREDFDSPMGRVRAIKIKPEVRYHGILKKAGDSFLWLTDDDRRFILRMEARVRIGTVSVELNRLEPGSAPISPEAAAALEAPSRELFPSPVRKAASLQEYYR